MTIVEGCADPGEYRYWVDVLGKRWVVTPGTLDGSALNIVSATGPVGLGADCSAASPVGTVGSSVGVPLTVVGEHASAVS